MYNIKLLVKIRNKTRIIKYYYRIETISKNITYRRVIVAMWYTRLEHRVIGARETNSGQIYKQVVNRQIRYEFTTR